MFYLLFLSWLNFFYFATAFPNYCPSSSTGELSSNQFFGPKIQNNETEWVIWFSQALDWRSQILQNISYKNNLYEDPKFSWAGANFISPQIQATDRYLYNLSSHEYTLNRFLLDINNRYGKIDSLLFWPAYPNMGIDNRNQFDWLLSIPGGLNSLKKLVNDFHSQKIKFYLPYNPWDSGTRREKFSDEMILAQLIEETGADGVFGDTMAEMGEKLFELTDSVLEPEGGGTLRSMNWTISGWGEDWYNGTEPCVDTLKWLERRRMSHQVHRWFKNKTMDVLFSLFNGVGYVSWENIFGIWNGITEMGAAQIRRAGTVMRYFHDIMHSDDWMPFYPTKIYNVFASVWREKSKVLIILINRKGNTIDKTVPVIDVSSLIQDWNLTNIIITDCYHGFINPNPPKSPILHVEIESEGFACLMLSIDPSSIPSKEFLKEMKEMSSIPLNNLSNEWVPLPQRLLTQKKTTIPQNPPENMSLIPEDLFVFVSAGIEIEGPDGSGVDVQYPWESSPQRSHKQTLLIPSFYIDKFPITNEQWRQFIQESGYLPKDLTNYLMFWNENKTEYNSSLSNVPVTWISPKEAEIYCKFYGKRLPQSYEWQYAAQGKSNFLYPWGNDEPNSTYIPNRRTGPELGTPDPVDAHPKGGSQFGVYDLVGNVWQWTDIFEDDHQRTCILKGGSYYYPQGSWWYFPQTLKLNQHNRYLLMDDSYDRAGTVGFRCVKDASEKVVQFISQN